MKKSNFLFLILGPAVALTGDHMARGKTNSSEFQVGRLDISLHLKSRIAYLCGRSKKLFGLLAFCCIALVQSAYASSVVVNSDEQLGWAMLTAGPGDTIYLEAGSYYGGYTLWAQATYSNPVTIKPVDVGTVYFKGPFTILGSGLVLDGIKFRSGGNLVIGSDSGSIDANTIRITNCSFRALTTDYWVIVREGAHNVTIDHNEFIDKQTEKQMLKIRPSASGNMNHIVRANYFADFARGDGNGYETLQIGQSLELSHLVTNVLVERNLFERADGEAEIISVKTSGNTVRYNTFRRSRGALVFRHGHNNLADGNIFLGEGVPGTSGIRFQGDNHVIVNNYMEDLQGFPLAIMDGVPDSMYDAVDTATVMFNSFIESEPLIFGFLNSTVDTKIPPEDLRFMNNVLYRSTGSDPFVVLADTGGDGLSDDQLVNPTIDGNIYHGGSPGLDDKSGFQNVDPQLVSVAAGLYGPGLYSPLINASVSSNLTVGFDVLGRERSGIADVGAVEAVVDWSPYPPLTQDDVGPYSSSSSLPPEPLPNNLAWMVPVINSILL